MNSTQNAIVSLSLFLGPVLAAMLPPSRERPNTKSLHQEASSQPVFIPPAPLRFPSASVLEAHDRSRIRRSFPSRSSRVMLLASRSAFRYPTNPL